MQEIVCPCGEDCLDQKGQWQVEPKEKASKKTGNPMVTKHKTLAGLHECMASYVLLLHRRWVQNAMVKIKLASQFRQFEYVTKKLDTFRVATPIFTSMQKVVEKLKFYRFSNPTEISEAAASMFGLIWDEMLKIVPNEN